MIFGKKPKICPFCGGASKIWKTYNGIKISCVSSCITMPSRHDISFSNKEIAIEAWNNEYLDKGYGNENRI